MCATAQNLMSFRDSQNALVKTERKQALIM